MARGYPDFEGEKSGVFLKPEWAAFEGEDKNFDGRDTNKPRNTGVAVVYLVPVGKTLYLDHLTFGIWANLAADADNNQMGHAYIYNASTVIYHVELGGNGGGAITLLKPIVILTGQTVQIVLQNRANHNCEVYVHAGGYEV